MSEIISADDAREYSESAGQIGEGWWRLIAWAFRQRIPEALGMSRREWRDYYFGYLRALPEEKGDAAAELTAEGMRQDEIADVFGVTQGTVSKWLSGKEYSSGIDNDPDQASDESEEVTPTFGDIPEEYSEPQTSDEERDSVHALLEGEPDPDDDLMAELEDAEDDGAPDLKPEPLQPVTPGWHSLGDHRLYCGDSMDEEFIEACQASAFAFADPPYNAGKAEWDQDFTWQHDYLADVGDIVAVTPGIAALAGFLTNTKMPYRWSMAAEITNGMTAGPLRFSNWICVTLYAHGSIYRKAKDHVRIPAATGDDQGGGHAARKPLRLLTHLIELFTTKGDTVVDPFLGSGTTLIAADRIGRRCIGAEIDPMHCAEIIDRYHQQSEAA